MKKDSYYFPHFYNARSDRKMLRVRKELGVEGYGIYFMLLEVLREQTDFSYPMEDIDLLAEEFKTSEQKVRTVICNYNLFQVNTEEFFYSEKLIQNLQPYIESSERARAAAKKRWDKVKELNANAYANAYANALPEQSKSNASQNTKRGEERRGKEKKVKDIKKKFGEYKNVLLTEEEYNKLLDEWGEVEFNSMLKTFSEGLKMKTYNYKDHNLAIRKWKSNKKENLFNQKQNLRTSEGLNEGFSSGI